MHKHKSRLNLALALMIVFSVSGMTVISISNNLDKSTDVRSQASSQDLVGKKSQDLVDKKTECIRTGCSGQICSGYPITTTCDHKEEYRCYDNAKCEIQANGLCGFTQDDKLLQCLAKFQEKKYSPADFNKDGFVNDVDYAIIIAEMKSLPSSPLADMNKDGRVDILDYSIFSSEYINFNR